MSQVIRAKLEGKMIPLRTLLARNIGCARRKADDLLDEAAEEGIALPKALDPATLPATIQLVDGEIILYDSYHLLLNKPVGCITALMDARHPTVMDYLEDMPLLPELRPVGRLDRETTGLLLFTTSGDYLHSLTHPKTGFPRTYHAALARPPAPYTKGMALEDGLVPTIAHLGPLPKTEVHPSLVPHPETQAFATITIVGGAYHEVRRIFAALSSHVLSLCRVSFGPFQLPLDLDPGNHQPIEGQAIARAIEQAKAAMRT